ncbi:hypothetical protein JCM11491_005168 [Sporobolomyces phaffii]
MGASSERRGRKIRREGGHRTPACKACQLRKVKCSGGSPCSACCRKAAWDGVPPPEYCEYDGGFIPARKPGTPSPSLPYGRRLLTHLSAAPPSTSRQPAGSPDAAEVADTKGKGKATKPLQKGLACLACKSRRVRCDGSKPSCGSCLRTAKRENRDPCCFYRADLHVAQQQLLERVPPPSVERHDESISPAEQDEDPQTSPRSASSSSSCSASPRLPPTVDYDMKIPESALPPLPIVSVLPTPSASSAFVLPPFPPITTRSSSSSTLSHSHTHSYPPSPALTHTSTDPSSSYPSPATPFSSVEDFCPPDNLYNYPPLPYPPASEDSVWAVPPLALDGPGSSASCARPVEFQTATHDLDLTLTLPMSPPAAFQDSTTLSLAPTPVKIEHGSGAGVWWEA